MARKHNTKHNRGRSNYKKRLADRGLSRTPVMKWTGMSYTQIQNAFDRLPHFRWNTVVEEFDGRKYTRQVRIPV